MTTPDAVWQIAVTPRTPADDAHGRTLLATARQAGFVELTRIASTRLYTVAGNLAADDVTRLAHELFADPVIQTWSTVPQLDWPADLPDGAAHVEVHLLPGVMDPVALSATDAARQVLGGTDSSAALTEVRTGWRLCIEPRLAADRLADLAERVLANPCMEAFYLATDGRRDALPEGLPVAPQYPFERRSVRLAGLTDDALLTLSRQGHLFLNLAEMHAVRDHFATLGRDPADIELEMIAQTWSEHCVHKTLKSAVVYRGRGFGVDAADEIEMRYDNLLKDTIVRATHELNRAWCWSVFEDNAGIVEFDDDYGVAFKVETHNHPSAIEPYGGSATGVGGCIRDILGCGLGAKPVANTDVFCLADPAFPHASLPPGVLRPRRVLRGVVAGVRDYGNRMGIPTVAGGLYFDNRYLANPLVFCGCVGLIPRDRIDKAPAAGDHVVVMGGRTGRDGIGGATFSSAELTDTHADEFSHAVQIGNAIEEKKVLDALLRARDHASACLYRSVTDCGAGGLSSAVGEMGAELGAEINLDAVPLKYSGLRYNEIWLSEAQERMVLAVPERNWAAFQQICAEEQVEAAVIGRFTGDGTFTLRFHGQEVGRLDAHFLHEGLPRQQRAATWSAAPPVIGVPPIPPPAADGTLADRLCSHLRHLNTCSRQAIIRQYDHEVQSGSVIKPIAGPGEGPSDAAVIRPRLASERGVAVGKGLCPQMADEDPYWMAIEAIDEAIRNVICVGARPDRIAILDNFCWGGCATSAEMGALVRACQGCYDAALAYGTPFISGKDSLNNQFSLSSDDAARLGLPAVIAIPHTLLISALGMVPQVTRCVTADLKHAGHRIVKVRVNLQTAGPAVAAELHHHVARWIADGQVRAAHDVSDGGWLTAVAEMAFAGRRGAELHLSAAEISDAFRAAGSAYVLEVVDGFTPGALPAAIECGELGKVTGDTTLTVHVDGIKEMATAMAKLAEAWQGGLQLEEA